MKKLKKAVIPFDDCAEKCRNIFIRNKGPIGKEDVKGKTNKQKMTNLYYFNFSLFELTFGVCQRMDL